MRIESLQFNGFQVFDTADGDIHVPKCTYFFDKWKGIPLKETFGGKPVIDFDGLPVFAELAISRLLIKSGWQSRWVETYGKSSKEPIFLDNWNDDKFKNQRPAPIVDNDVKEMLNCIAQLNGNSYSGCWDVLGWKGKDVIFVESKRNKRDSIRPTQTNWLTSGLRFGLKNDNFLVVEWDFNE